MINTTQAAPCSNDHELHYGVMIDQVLITLEHLMRHYQVVGDFALVRVRIQVV